MRTILRPMLRRAEIVVKRVANQDLRCMDTPIDSITEKPEHAVDSAIMGMTGAAA
jgi:hypothetical protein